jgi:hypothetical protein
MRSILRKVILASAFGVVAALAANSAMAETRVNVPFDFKVAGATLSAGTYQIVRDWTGAFVTLRSVNSKASYTWLLNPGPSEESKKIALRFDDRSGIHVLQAVQYGSKITPRLDTSKSIDLERESEGQ